MGIDLYVSEGIPTGAALLWDPSDENALLMEVLMLLGQHHVLAVHSPHSLGGHDVYLQWWADMWRQAT